MKSNEEPIIVAALAIILGGTAISLAQQNVQGSVELSNGAKVQQNPSLPKLNLTNPQREQIRKTVLTEHNEVEFRLAATKSAKTLPLRLVPTADRAPRRRGGQGRGVVQERRADDLASESG